MRALRILFETDDEGRPTAVPKLPPRARVEAIFLVLDEGPAEPARRPSPELAASIRIVGDPIAPVLDPEEWEALR